MRQHQLNVFMAYGHHYVHILVHITPNTTTMMQVVVGLTSAYPLARGQWMAELGIVEADPQVQVCEKWVLLTIEHAVD